MHLPFASTGMALLAGSAAAAQPVETSYLVIVHPAGRLDKTSLGAYWTEVPAISACTSEGRTVEEAVEKTRQDIARWLERVGRARARPFDVRVEIAF